MNITRKKRQKRDTLKTKEMEQGLFNEIKTLTDRNKYLTISLGVLRNKITDIDIESIAI